MYESLEVRNYQSLVHVKLDLGRLTLITGESSSGKSALYRSLQFLASNERGMRFLTMGAKQTSVTLSSEKWVVTLERSQGQGAYRILDLENNTEETFTKLGGSVPERVTQVIRLDPNVDKGSINFADQFVPPYLLMDTGSQVARVLGELTNVSRILEAVRESNRIRLGIGQELKTREADLSSLRSQVEKFKDIPAQSASLVKAETALERVKDLQSKHDRLRSLIDDITIAKSVLARTVLPEVPDISHVTELQASFVDFQGVVKNWLLAKRKVELAASAIDECVKEEEKAHTDLHDALVAAGECPTCGSKISD